MDTRPHQTTEFFGKRSVSITLEDSVRVRDGQTHIFRDAIVVAIATDEMTVHLEVSLVPIVVPMKSVKRHGADGDYADGRLGPVVDLVVRDRSRNARRRHLLLWIRSRGSWTTLQNFTWRTQMDKQSPLG